MGKANFETMEFDCKSNFGVAVVFGKHVYLDIWCLLFAPLGGGSFSAKRKHRYLPREVQKCLHKSRGLVTVCSCIAPKSDGGKPTEVFNLKEELPCYFSSERQKSTLHRKVIITFGKSGKIL